MENTNEMSQNAVLINLNVRTWAANVMDKNVSSEIADLNGTDKRRGRFWKTLVSKGKGTALGEIYAVERVVRKFHYENTLPWMHDGSRILPTANYQAYMEKMREFKQQFDAAVAAFLNHYDAMKESARTDLKALYRESDYPARSDVGRRFGLGVNVLPMPKTETFSDSSSLGAMEVERIKRELETDLAITYQRANEDLWTRLYSCVSNLQERLNGDPQYLREQVLENVSGLVDLLPRLNVSNDAKLADLGEKLKSTFSGMTASGLRQDEVARTETADKVAAIESMMASFMGGRPQKMEFKHAA